MNKLQVLLLCIASAVISVVVYIGVDAILSNKSKSENVVISGPSSVNAGDIIEYKANVNNKSWWLNDVVYQWKVLNENGEVIYRNISSNDILFPSGINPGRYFVMCSAVANYNYFVRSYVKPLDFTCSMTVVNIGPNPGPEPSPTPGPGPNPPPPPPGPTPVTIPLYAVAIYDNNVIDKLPAEQIAIKNSQSIGPALATLQTKWMWRDVASPEVSGQQWKNLISKYGTPCLIIADKSGNTYNGSGSLPKDENTLIQLVSKLRGK